MIVELLLDLVKSAILFIIRLFPTLPEMDFLTDSLDAVLSVLVAIDSFVSVRLFSICVVFLFAFTHIEFIWSIIMWVIRKIPGVS